jgi:hypothetical protein
MEHRGSAAFHQLDGYAVNAQGRRLWRDLPPSKYVISAIEVIFGDDARLGADDAALNPHYVTHAFHGVEPRAGTLSSALTQVRKGQQSLEGCAPYRSVLSFVSAEYSGMRLTLYVEARRLS